MRLDPATIEAMEWRKKRKEMLRVSGDFLRNVVIKERPGPERNMKIRQILVELPIGERLRAEWFLFRKLGLWRKWG